LLIYLQSANFWIIAAAIRQFYDKHHLLPLPGSVPDMKAQSADYIQLQNVYKNKARKDLAEVLDSIRLIQKSLRRSVTVPDQEVEAFCKGAASIKLLRGSPMKINAVGSGIAWGDRARFICT
jgi:amyloid beta precursor protein binding protein 1